MVCSFNASDELCFPAFQQSLGQCENQRMYRDFLGGLFDLGFFFCLLFSDLSNLPIFRVALL